MTIGGHPGSRGARSTTLPSQRPTGRELRDRGGGGVADQARPGEPPTLRSVVSIVVVRDVTAMLKETLARLDGFDGAALAEVTPLEVKRLAASVDDGIELLHRFRQQLKDAGATS